MHVMGNFLASLSVASKQVKSKPKVHNIGDNLILINTITAEDFRKRPHINAKYN